MSIRSVADLPEHLQAQARAQLVRSQLSPARKPKIVEVEPAKGDGRKPSKYRNEPVVLDGFHFDSKRESARYLYLKSLQAIGTIAALQLQVPFFLEVNGAVVGEYVADFTYRIVDTDRAVIEDVKGAKTPYYLLKRRIMDALGHHICEVTRTQAPAGWDARTQPKKGT